MSVCQLQTDDRPYDVSISRTIGLLALTSQSGPSFKHTSIRRMEKISWLDTVEEVLRSVNEDRQILKSVWQRIGQVLRHNRALHEIIEGRMRSRPTRGREEFKCYMIWQMMLLSNRQLRTGKDGDTEKGCQKPVMQQKTTKLN